MTPLQKFNMLPEKQRKAVLDKYRYWNVEHIDSLDADDKIEEVMEELVQIITN